MGTSILTTATSYHKGYRAAWSPHIRRYTAIPLICNMIIFGILFYVLQLEVNGLIGWVTDYRFSGWLGFLNPMMRFLGVILYWLLLIPILILTAFTANTVTCFVAAMFNSRLSDRVAVQYALATNISGHTALWRDIFRECHKVFYYIRVLIWVCLLSVVLFLIPGGQLLLPVIWWLFGAWVIAVEYLDIPADNQNLTFRQSINILRMKRAGSLCFGSIGLFILSIPLLNMIFIPILVAAGTFYWHEISKS